MLIEKVITNFSDVSLWAIALVVGYVLIGAIFAIKIGMEKKTYQDGECHSKHTH